MDERLALLETQLQTKSVIKPGALVVGIVAAVSLALDQLTKYMVVQGIGMGGYWTPVPGIDWVRLIPTINTGTACGYFPQLSAVFTFAPFLILGVVILFYRSQKTPSWLLSIGVGLIVGGAFGNLLDRLRLGYVLDFVQVANWPVFNVADSAVSTAVVLMLLWSLREDSGKPAFSGSAAGAAQTGANSSWKLGLVFLVALGLVAVASYFVCVFVPTNLLR